MAGRSDSRPVYMFLGRYSQPLRVERMDPDTASLINSRRKPMAIESDRVAEQGFFEL